MPLTAVNKARDAYAGGEHKSDPKDAFVIADQLRLRWKSLSEVRVRDENVAELRALVAYRRDLVQDLTRLRELLVGVLPGSLRSQEGRRQKAHPGSDRARSQEGQCSVGDAA